VVLPTGSEPKPRFWALCAATLFEFISLGMFLVTIPLLVTEDLGGSKRAAGLAVSSFAITALLARPWVGRQLDRRGRKPFVVVAPIVLIITSTGLAFAPSLWAVIGLRLFQGVAAAGFYTGAATMATDLAGQERRAQFIARLSLFLYGGFTIGPALAEWLIDHHGLGWAWAASAGSASIALCFLLVLPETAPAVRPAGKPGPMRLLHPAAVGPGVVLLGAAVGYTSITAFSALFAREIGMKSSGTMFAAFAVSIFSVRLISGQLADHYGRFRVAFPGLLAGAAGLAILATVPPPWLALVGVAVYGTGFALVFPALTALAVDRAPEAERGAALGTFTAFFDVATATSGAAIGAVADARGFGTAWATTSALCLVSAALLVRLHVRERAGHIGPAGPALPEPAGT
jgi:MFS family permease